MPFFKYLILSTLFAVLSHATVYEVGPGKPYTKIGGVPWATLAPGDTVLIYWRSTPYYEKWAIGTSGTAAAPITVRGVMNSSSRPIIDGQNAITPANLRYTNPERSVLKIGGTSVPADIAPQYIVIENLEFRKAHTGYNFTNFDGSTVGYVANAASIHVEKGSHITIRNCNLSSSGNGLFIGPGPSASPNSDFLIESNYFVSNGNIASSQEHHSNTHAAGITFQYNRYGTIRAGSDGNGLTDRSAGTVVRYNWFTAANRQLDLVDSDSPAIVSDPRYRQSFVYGNTFIEDVETGNRQIVRYGGDSGTTANYRKGTLQFYNNTVVSMRTQTAVFQLSTAEERGDARNNIFYVTGAGNSLMIVDMNGVVELRRNWMKTGWRMKDSGSGTVIDDGSTISTASPGFINEGSQDYRIAAVSPNVDTATALNPAVLPQNNVLVEYLKHQKGVPVIAGLRDIGAYSGSPLSGPIVLVPRVTLAPATLTFAAQIVGTISATQTVTVSNTGTAALSISSIAVSGANAADFSRSTTCGATVAAGATCTVTITFIPQAAGTRTASLAVTSNASGSAHTVTLSGTGTLAQQTTVYEVGPGKPFTKIGAVPWATLRPGDTVLIHWQPTPYFEKWAIGTSGTAAAPITVRGVMNSSGLRPVIDGQNAVTPANLSYWNADRSLLKIGGTSVPPDVAPEYIVIENLEFRNASTANTFTNYNGATVRYLANAAAIQVEKGSHITIRNCILSSSGNGLFISPGAAGFPNRDFLIESNHFVGNGNVGSSQEHHSYTNALGITFQYNRYDTLRPGADGNALKDRSAGAVVRYNWFGSANRQLDFVDSGNPTIVSDPRYHETFVYGNTIVEEVQTGNRQIVHYGGDTGTTLNYRKGTLHFYNNTVISTRTSSTALFRLSTAEERCDARNNIFYVTAAGNTLKIVDINGVVELHRNWMKAGWQARDSGLGTVIDDGSTISTASPGFLNEATQDYRLAAGSLNIDAATLLNPLASPQNDMLMQYVKHLTAVPRVTGGRLDVGAYEKP